MIDTSALKRHQFEDWQAYQAWIKSTTDQEREAHFEGVKQVVLDVVQQHADDPETQRRYAVQVLRDLNDYSRVVGEIENKPDDPLLMRMKALNYWLGVNVFKFTPKGASLLDRLEDA